MADGADGRLELLANIKAHSQQLTTENKAAGADAAAAGLGAGGGWSDEEWRGAFQQLVGFSQTVFSLFFFSSWCVLRFEHLYPLVVFVVR